MNKINNLYIVGFLHKLIMVSCDSIKFNFYKQTYILIINNTKRYCELNHKWFESIAIDILRTIY